MKKRIGLFVFLSFIGMQTIFAQTVTINGRVTDVADNAPLPGVSVRIRVVRSGWQRISTGNILYL